MRRLQLWFLTAVLLAFAPLRLSAQTVQVTVVQAVAGQPLVGSLVVLLDASGRQAAGALTGEDGRSTLRAPAAGTYRLKVERVGFATALTPAFDLAAGEELTRRVELPVAAIALKGLTARGSRRCVLRPEEGTQMHRVWEEARKALNASAWADSLRLVQYSSIGYKRDLDPEGRLVLREEVHPRSGSGGRPYASRPAKELAERGYVQPDGDGWMHYGPDAEVLLSDVFLDTHCFRVQAGKGENQGRVGLAFEPMRGNRRPDVKGVLWLDAKSIELRTLDFEYTNLPQAYGGDRRSGGRVEFERLPNGIWIVRRWWIRGDRMELQTTQFMGRTVQNPIITAIEETGGEVVDVRVRDVAVAGDRPRRAVLEGVVAYPSRAQMPGATEVFLLGTPYRAPVDSLGHFRLADLPAGLYTASLAHPQLTELKVGVETQEVMLRPDAPARVDLAFPSPETVVEAACANSRPEKGEERTGLVFGTARESTTGAPVANLQVGVTWVTYVTNMERINQVNRRVLSTTDSEGRFLICDVPFGVNTQLRVTERGASAAPIPVLLGGSAVVRQDLTVRTRTR